MTSLRTVTCDSLLHQISGYLDGDLPEATCAAIERHAEGCRACGRVIDDFRRTTGLCRKAATAPLPADVRKRARARVKALLGASSSRRPRSQRPPTR